MVDVNNELVKINNSVQKHVIINFNLINYVKIDVRSVNIAKLVVSYVKIVNFVKLICEDVEQIRINVERKTSLNKDETNGVNICVVQTEIDVVI